MQNASLPKQAGGLLVTADLIFSTKITGTARALGLEMRVVASPQSAAEELAALAATEPAAPPAVCVIIDLSLRGLTADDIRAIVTASGGSPVIAFGSHVDTAALDAARAAGCTDVMPRSRFVSTLPQLLERFVAPTADS